MQRSSGRPAVGRCGGVARTSRHACPAAPPQQKAERQDRNILQVSDLQQKVSFPLKQRGWGFYFKAACRHTPPDWRIRASVRQPPTAAVSGPLIQSPIWSTALCGYTGVDVCLCWKCCATNLSLLLRSALLLPSHLSPFIPTAGRARSETCGRKSMCYFTFSQL